MKSLLILFFTFISLTSFGYVCKKSVDPKKVVVFLDANNSYAEVVAAQKAACSRGESIVIHPHSEESLQTFSRAKYDYDIASERVRVCENRRRKDSSVNCNDTYLKRTEATNKFNTISNQTSYKEKRLDGTTVRNLFKSLADKDIEISSVVASGHDGGGAFRGSLGALSKSDISLGIKNAYKGKEDLLADFTSILLWGCYTTNPAEVMSWRTLFPGLNVIAGFDGSGPNNIRPAGANYLKDILLKEKDITTADRYEDIKNLINKVKHINYTFHGIWARSTCSAAEFYQVMRKERQSDGKDKYVRHTIDFDNPDCDFYREFSKHSVQMLDQFFAGHKDIPHDTDNGVMRNVYTFLRQSSHALDKCGIRYSATPDQAGLLLFYRDVYKNFLNVFEKEIEDGVNSIHKLEREFASNLSTDELDEQEEEIQDAIRFLKRASTKKKNSRGMSYNDFKYLSKDTQNLILDKIYERLSKTLKKRADRKNDNLVSKAKYLLKYSNQAIDHRNSKELLALASNDYREVRRKKDTIKSLRNAFRYRQQIPTNSERYDIRKRVGNYLAYLSSLSNGLKNVSSDDIKNEKKKISKLMNVYKKFAWELDTECMDFLEWHEVLDSGELPKVLCEI